MREPVEVELNTLLYFSIFLLWVKYYYLGCDMSIFLIERFLFFWPWINLIFYAQFIQISVQIKINLKCQLYPKSVKINAFDQKNACNTTLLNSLHDFDFNEILSSLLVVYEGFQVANGIACIN